MVLIQLLLPINGTAGVEGLAPLATTRRELAHRFNGLTAYLRSPAKGLWTAPDARHPSGSDPGRVRKGIAGCCSSSQTDLVVSGPSSSASSCRRC